MKRAIAVVAATIVLVCVAIAGMPTLERWDRVSVANIYAKNVSARAELDKGIFSGSGCVRPEINRKMMSAKFRTQEALGNAAAEVAKARPDLAHLQTLMSDHERARNEYLFLDQQCTDTMRTLNFNAIPSVVRK